MKLLLLLSAATVILSSATAFCVYDDECPTGQCCIGNVCKDCHFVKNKRDVSNEGLTREDLRREDGGLTREDHSRENVLTREDRNQTMQRYKRSNGCGGCVGFCMCIEGVCICIPIQ